MSSIPHLLVVCGRNKKRSKTAEAVFRNDPRFQIRSAGVSPKSERKLTEKDMLWADWIMVMESDQRRKIQETFRFELPPIEVLHIPDDYEFMDDDLVMMLTAHINETMMREFEV